MRCDDLPVVRRRRGRPRRRATRCSSAAEHDIAEVVNDVPAPDRTRAGPNAIGDHGGRPAGGPQPEVALDGAARTARSSSAAGQAPDGYSIEPRPAAGVTIDGRPIIGWWSSTIDVAAPAGDDHRPLVDRGGAAGDGEGGGDPDAGSVDEHGASAQAGRTERSAARRRPARPASSLRVMFGALASSSANSGWGADHHHEGAPGDDGRRAAAPVQQRQLADEVTGPDTHDRLCRRSAPRPCPARSRRTPARPRPGGSGPRRPRAGAPSTLRAMRASSLSVQAAEQRDVPQPFDLLVAAPEGRSRPTSWDRASADPAPAAAPPCPPPLSIPAQST